VTLGTDSRSSEGPTELVPSTGHEAVWRAYPMTVRLIRSFVLVLPVAVSTGAVFLLDEALPAPRSWEGYAGFVAANVLAVLIVVCAINRLAVRLLPLATLLSLSLVFPDRAPKRFRIALRANSSAQMRSRLLEARDSETDLATALEDLLTYLAALGRHDRITRGHCERVRAFVDLLAPEMGLSESDRVRLRWAALLHDIGKLQVPARILRKPGMPTKSEWDTLKQHPVDGEKLVRPLTPWLGTWKLAVEQHHERFDGSGYPKGLAGADISLGGRIVAVADAYEVMITSRPYKRPVRPEAARRELVRLSDQQFDPVVVRAFLRIAIGDLRKATGLLGVLAQVPILATVPRAESLIEIAGRQAIGVVGTAAGTGAIVAATTLSPIQAPAAMTQNKTTVAHSAVTVGVVESAAHDSHSEHAAANLASETAVQGISQTESETVSASPSEDTQTNTVHSPEQDQGTGSPAETGPAAPLDLASGVTKTVEGATAIVGTTEEGLTPMTSEPADDVTSSVESAEDGAQDVVGTIVSGTATVLPVSSAGSATDQPPA
jgi:HD domain